MYHQTAKIFTLNVFRCIFTCKIKIIRHFDRQRCRHRFKKDLNVIHCNKARNDLHYCKQIIFFCVCPDVCNSTDLPEFEIISLLEEQLPVYRLRADTVYGYDNDDWLHTPLVASDASLELTSEQIEETLKYFRKFKTLHSGRKKPSCTEAP